LSSLRATELKARSAASSAVPLDISIPIPPNPRDASWTVVVEALLP
jgi:hypothetical protein